MDMRPQAHDIIRTWLFSHRGPRPPWSTAACRGSARRSRASILDPTARRCQVQGQRGRPPEMLDKFGADAVRYWAAMAGPGDTAFDEGR
jgi:valyl-tRNA synthetase